MSVLKLGLTETALRKNMHKDLTTLFTGRNSTFIKEVDSTNSYLARALKIERLPEGTLLSASKQVTGRGQSGAHWESEEGKNLLVSFVFYPNFILPKDIFLLNKTFSLAVYDFVKELTNQAIKIKWPNDIYWNHRKLAGILIENSISSSAISHSILGIGINVNQTRFSSTIPNPVSLYDIVGIELDPDELLGSLCSYIEARYLQLKMGERGLIESDYNKVMYSINEWRTFNASGETFEGKIISVDENGRLVVEDRNGELLVFNAKEISFKR